MRNKTIFLILLFLGALLQQGFSQFSPISGVINDYASVESLYLIDDNDVDSVLVGQALDANWNTGDTVLVHCVKGGNLKVTGADEDIGNFDPLYQTNVGKYGFFIINEIVEPLREVVVLNSHLKGFSDIKAGEVFQLVKVKSYRRAEVTGTLTAKEWDGSTGGVVALFVQRTLKLTANIDVTGKGFMGASEGQDYTGACPVTDTVPYDSMFYHDHVVLAGRKGEGITRTNFVYTRGKARSINGGGGGNARMSGGGGGSNYSKGGDGGFESSICRTGTDTWGRGGYRLSSYFYENDDDYRKDRVFFGGGGGTGTQVTGRSSTSGGDGGGLVFIVADSIIGNNHQITADGNSVSTAATAAGGGGGGGGGIVLDVHNYGTTLDLRAVGGNGGDTDFEGDTTGPGGGGGGGFYWLSSGSKPVEVEAELTASGQGGKHQSPSVISYGASIGGTPGLKTALVTPLRGFLFNTVPDHYTICSDEIPETIVAGDPRGGDGPGTYTYEWLDSTRLHSWQPATYGTYTEPDFEFSAPLSDTTWYRRVVRSGTVLPRDTSFRIAVYVHPEITGNVIAAPDTVCSGNRPLNPFIPDDVIQGGPHGHGEFTWQWIKQPEGSGFEDATGPGVTDSSYHALPLTITTNFARIAYSGACTDTSVPVLVKVWEKLTGNEITPNDTICYDTSPDELGGDPPQNGDQSDIRYLWQGSTDTLTGWNLIAAEENQSYQPGDLTETAYFRRIVLSGSDDACIDTSNAVEVLNIPLITGNTISGDQTVCTNQFGIALTGSAPGGGYQGEYSFQWESRTLSSGWVPASGVNDLQTDYDPGEMTGDTTWYRRVVGSGRVSRNECLDYSDSVAVNVLPLITGNMITAPDTVQCQLDTVGIITQDPAAGTKPGGGAIQAGVDPRYQWETAIGPGTPGAWTVIAGADQLDYDGQPVLGDADDRFFRRIVYSGPEEQCKDTALLKITVHTQITGNTVEPFDSVCFADTKLLQGTTPSGESGLTPVYTWRDLNSGTDLPGSDQEDFTTGPFDQLGQYHYHRRVAIGECVATSNEMQITVMQLPGGQLTDDPFLACEKDTVLSIDLNMDELQTYVTPWQVYLRNQDISGIGPIPVNGDGPLAVTLDIGALDSRLLNYEIDSIIYRSVEARYKCYAPADNMSGLVPVTVFRQPDPQIIVDGDSTLLSYSLCSPTLTLGVNTDNGTGTWSSDPPGFVSFTTGAGPDEYLASIPDQHDVYGTYQLIFTSQAGDCSGVAVLNATFDEQPDPPVPGENTMVFLRNSYQMQAEPATAGTGTWVALSGGAQIEDPNDPHTNVYELSDSVDNVFKWTVSNGVCRDSSDLVIVYWNEVKRYEGFSPNGDMENEYFIMQGLAYADEFEISFFNSLGNTVRTVTNETMDEMVVDESLISGGLKEDELVVWDGLSNNGNPVPSGTYYFVIDLMMYQRDWQTGNITGQDTFQHKGYVVLMRE